VDPASLSGCFDCSGPVVAARPFDRVGGRMPGQDGHAGNDGAGSAGAAGAGDLDALAGSGQQVGAFDSGCGEPIVAWSAKVGPVDPVRGPVRLPLRTVMKQRSPRPVGWSTEVEPEVGKRPRGQRLAAAPPTNQGAVGQVDHPGERLSHLDSFHRCDPRRESGSWVFRLQLPGGCQMQDAVGPAVQLGRCRGRWRGRPRRSVADLVAVAAEKVGGEPDQVGQLVEPGPVCRGCGRRPAAR
jgi:hypothetical protein